MNITGEQIVAGCEGVAEYGACALDALEAKNKNNSKAAAAYLAYYLKSMDDELDYARDIDQQQ